MLAPAPIVMGPPLGTVFTYEISGAVAEVVAELTRIESVVVAHTANGWRLAVGSKSQAAMSPIAGGRFWFLGGDLNASTYSVIPDETLIAFPLVENKAWTTRIASAGSSAQLRAHRVDSLTTPWETENGWRIEGVFDSNTNARLTIEYAPRLHAITLFDSRDVQTGRVFGRIALSSVGSISPADSAYIATPSTPVSVLTPRLESAPAAERSARDDLLVSDADMVLAFASHYGFACPQLVMLCVPQGSTTTRVTDPHGKIVSEHEILLEGGQFVETFFAENGSWRLEANAQGRANVGIRAHAVSFTTYTWDGSAFASSGVAEPFVFFPETETDASNGNESIWTIASHAAARTRASPSRGMRAVPRAMPL